MFGAGLLFIDVEAPKTRALDAGAHARMIIKHLPWRLPDCTTPRRFATYLFKSALLHVFSRIMDASPSKRYEMTWSPSQRGAMENTKLLWDEDSIEEHLGQLRPQESALQLLLLVLHAQVHHSSIL